MVNKTIFQGRMVRDPELKHTQSDVSYTEFTVAWSEKYKEIETKCFLRCKAWRSTAEFISKYFRKGQEIVIDGHMITEEWKSEGENKSRTICIVEKANFCGSKSSDNDAQQGRPQPSTAQPPGDGFYVPDIDEELPFS